MRTIVLASLFFCMTLCVTLLPVFAEGQDPEKLPITPTTYLLLVIPAMAAANALFVFIIYYAPLRRLFYALERSLLTLVKAREAIPASSAALGGGGGASAPAAASVTAVQQSSHFSVPRSAVIDYDSTRHGSDTILIADLMDGLSKMVQLRDMELVTESGAKLLEAACSLMADSEELKLQQKQRREAAAKDAVDSQNAAAGPSARIKMRDHSPQW